MKRKSLMRRVLASILCATLVFQNISVTAYATETVAEPVTEISTEETSEEASEEKASEENVSEKTSETQSSESEAASEESEAVAVVDEEADAEKEEGSEQVTTDVVAEQTEAASDIKSEESVVSQEEETAKVLDAEIKINEDSLIQYLKTNGYHDAENKYYKLAYDSAKKVIKSVYNNEKTNPFDGLLDHIKDNKNIVSVDVKDAGDANESDTETALKSKLAYKWQLKNAEGTYTDMAAGEVPVNPGEYKLVISLDESLAKADSKEISFEIEKAKLTVNTSEFNAKPKSGITVKEIKDELTKAVYLTEAYYTLYDYDEGEYVDIKCDMDKYIKALNITVRKSADTQALEDTEVLLKGEDYSVNITAELIDDLSANCELKQSDVINLKITELKPTTLTIDDKSVETEKNITRVYTGKEVEAPTATGDTPEITVVVTSTEETDEATGEAKVLTVEYDKLTKAWYDANGNELETAPINAGEYTYKITYTDESGIYAEASDEIKVVVEAADVVIVPAISTTDYFVGMTAKDVLANVTYTVKNADGTDFAGEFNAETFWGVSYNNSDLPQSYAPVFKLQKGTEKTVKNDEGKDEKQITWTDVTGTISTPTGTDSNEVTTSYRVVFSGKKALFKNGSIINDTAIDINATDVNSAEKNYKVDTTAEKVEETYKVDVTVNANATATIDVTAMLIERMAADTTTFTTGDTIYTKVYDAKSLYADRAEYKKAVVKDADGKEIAKDTASELSYQWYRYTIDESSIDKDGKKIVKPVLGSRIDASYWTSYYSNPYNAGLYALKVSYNDSTKAYAAKPVTIYFKIEKQLVKVIPDADLEAYEGTTVSDFLKNISQYGYKVYQIPNNKVDCTFEELVEIPELGSEAFWATEPKKRLYEQSWYVKEGDNTDPEKAEYKEYTGTFKLGVPYKYGLKLTYLSYPYSSTNYADNYQVVEEDVKKTVYTCEDKKITVKPMGDIELEFIIDKSKLPETEKVYDGKAFDITEAIANGLVTVVKKNTDEVVPTTGENAIELEYKWFYRDIDSFTTYPVHADEYELKVRYAGCDTYKVTEWVKIADFKIEQREITVTPYVNETILAGLHMSDSDDIALVVDDSKMEIKGFIEEDAAAFAVTDSINNVPAFNYSYNHDADDIEEVYFSELEIKFGDNNYYGYIRTGKEYSVNYETEYRYSYYDYEDECWNTDEAATSPLMVVNEDVLYDKNSNNYKVVVTPVTFTPNKRGNSKVTSTSYDKISATKLKAEYSLDDYTAKIVPVEGIPYCYDMYLEEDVESGNYFVFEIYNPNEYYAHETYDMRNKAIYKNSIENAGGIILADSSDYITVAFNAAAPESGDNIRTFDIIWEEGYKESFTVDFTNASLEDDLEVAVAPKTLAFNGVNGKMIVGEGQQLDVKFTKNLIDDVICLNYEVLDGQDVVTVSSEGYVTALKPGKATVAVYPVKRDRKGNETRLEFKTVSTKITVSDVTAPKVSKVYAYDKEAEVQYTKPADGYRREIYVLEGKGLKPADFETKIAEMNQNKFDGTLMVIGVDESKFDSKKKIVTTTIEGLKPVTDYTVYVRNVSAIRTNAEDGLVVLSAKGNVKSFKTSKVQLEDISIYFDSEQNIDNKGSYYDVLLSEKKVKVSAQARYEYMYENDAADYTDGVWYKLPIEKSKQSTYENPKLTYYALSGMYKHNKKEGVYTLKIGDYYCAPSTIAKVDKNGNVSLNGVGKVYIVAYDSLTKKWSNTQTLNIKTSISKISAKAITAKVGEPVYVDDYLTFYDSKNKKIKLEKYYGFAVNTVVKNGEGIELYGDEITANLSNQTITLNVALAGYPEINTDVTVKTKAMTPVKGLKAVNVLDDSAKIVFTHSINNYDFNEGEFAYKLEIRDKRNALVREELIDITNLGYDYDNSNSAKRVFAYYYTVNNLVRKSDYKISVTPVYGTETAKAATTKVKTIEVPAYRGSLLDKDDYDEGMDIYTGAYDEEDGFRCLINYGYFTSGKLYTFHADAITPDDGRPTDTLTWKSSNPGVATIKANAGTYSATFNAIKPGYTFIEVSSKLRKGVVARYRVCVKAVGSAGDKESGDYEIAWDPNYEGKVEVLTEANPVRVSADYYDYSWVKFEAPADGRYTFTMPGMYKYWDEEDEEYEWYTGKYYYYYSVAGGYSDLGWSTKYTYDEYDNNTGAYCDSDEITLKKGEIIYLRGNGSFEMTVKGNHYAKLTTTNKVNAQNAKTIVFTAPKDNYYTFNATVANKYARFYVNDSYKQYSALSNNNTENCSFALNKGDEVRIELSSTGNYDVFVTYRKPVVLTAKEAAEIKDIKKGDVAWYSFTADVTGNYTFTSTDATEVIKAELYAEGITDASYNYIFDNGSKETIDGKEVDNTKNIVREVDLNKGQTVLIKVYTNSEKAASAKLNVKLPTFDTVTLGTPKTVAVAKDGETWVSFVADEDNAKYTFSVAKEEGKNYSVTSVYYNSKLVELEYGAEFTTNELKKGDVVNIKLSVSGLADDVNSANVIVTVTKTTATEIKLGEAANITAENNGVYYFTFTAPAYGLYEFKSEVTANKEQTHSLEADRYIAVNKMSPSESGWATNYYNNVSYGNDFYREVKLVAGEKVVFAVEANSVPNVDDKAVTTSAKISVSQVTATALPAEEITFAKDSVGEVRWYKFTAKEDDTYTVKFEYKNGDDYVSGLNGYAVVSKAATLAGLESLTSVYEYGYSGTLSAGESVFFRVVSTNSNTEKEAKIKISVTGAASLVEEIPASAFDVAKGETKIYKYTVTKAGRYKVSFKSNTAGVNATVEKGDSYNSYYDTVSNNQEFVCRTIGKTYYFRVTTDNADAENKASVTLSFDEIVPAELTNGTAEVTFKKETGTKWFAYTVPATGRYIIEATKTVGETKETTDVNCYKNIYAYTGTDTDEWHKKSDVIYIELYNNDASDEVKYNITVKPVEAKDIAANTATDVTLKKNEYAWYKFTADADTYYSFDFKYDEGSFVYRYFLTGDNNLYEGPRYLKAGETILVKVTRYYDSSDKESLTAKLTINKETMVELKEGEALEVKTLNGGKQYVSFKPSRTATYAFYVKDVEDGVNGINSSIGLHNYYVVRHCTIAQTFNFYVGANFTTEAGKEDTKKGFKLCVEEVVPTELEADKAVEAKVAKYQKAWFTFEAPETGRYTFTADNATVDVDAREYYNGIEYPDYYAGLDMPCEYQLFKGSKITLSVQYANAKSSDDKAPAEATINVKISKVVPKDITVGDTTADIESNAKAWYAFKAPSNGVYTFTAENGSAYIYNKFINGDYTTGSRTISAGQTVYVQLINNYAEKKTVKLTVKLDTEVTTFDTLDKAQKVEFTEDDVKNNVSTKWIAFKAPKSGYYNLKQNSNSYIYYVIDGVRSNMYSGSNYNKFVGKDELVYFEVRNYTSAAKTVEITVSEGSTKFIYDTIALNNSKTVEFTESGSHYYEFVAPASGTYEFIVVNAEDTKSTYKEVVVQDNRLSSSSGSYVGNYNAKVSCYVEAGAKYYVRIYGNSGAKFDINVVQAK